ncbi:hypothetical protein L7F22_023533 [Adiantum nelumboides]|nr:hypothetical protein [Adiantum nelumboides]
MSAVLALPQVKDFLKTLAKEKEKGQDQGKEHDVNAHAVTEEGEPSKKPWDEDIPELSSPSYSPPTSFSYSFDSSSSSNPRRRRDLGLSKVKQQTFVSGGVRGTLPWMAPELLNGSSSLVSEKVDVFSFGIVMWELLTGEEPYANMHYGAIIGGIVNNTLRPTVPRWCDAAWRSLMEKCWAADPGERPTFLEIATALRAMEASIAAKGPGQAHILEMYQ